MAEEVKEVVADEKPHCVVITVHTESVGMDGKRYVNQQHSVREGAFDAEELVRKHFFLDEAVSKAVRQAMEDLAAGAWSPSGEGFAAAKERVAKRGGNK